MYTYGYLKENVLAKLNLTEAEAQEQKFLSNFPFYANEAMTQICSAIKPKEVFFTFDIDDEKTAWDKIRDRYKLYLDKNSFEREEIKPFDLEYSKKIKFWKEWDERPMLNKVIEFPDDFIAFSDDVPQLKKPPLYLGGVQANTPKFEEVYDDVVQYYGYNQVICTELGSYKIPYKARWFFFTKTLEDNTIITAPADICDAIPLYIASQCIKIDDETRASIFRNEFELAIARIDNTTFKSQRGFYIDGGW